MQKEMKILFIKWWMLGAALILLSSFAHAQTAATQSKPVDWENVPPALRDAFSQKPLDGKYDVNTRINPFYLRGDFDGDGTADYAVLVTEVASHKQGILVRLSSIHKFVFLGAGTPIQYGAKPEDDLDFDEWRILGPNPADKISSLELPP